MRMWMIWTAIGLLAQPSADRAMGQPSGPATRPYVTAHDAPLEASERQVASQGRHRQYRVEFNGIEKGRRVPAFVYVPEGEGPHPAVLLQYGSGGNKNTNYIVAVGREFVEAGFVVLTIDVPGRGERRGQADGDTLRDRVDETLGDYSRAVDYLASRVDVDASRLAFVGISWGAITGIPFVAHDQRVKVMASLVGGGNFQGWLKDGRTDEQRRASAPYDPIYHVGAIAPRPLLLLNVTRDQLVSRFFADALHKAAGEHAKKVWLEADHFFNGVDRQQVTRDVVVKFVKEGLGGERAERMVK